MTTKVLPIDWVHSGEYAFGHTVTGTFIVSPVGERVLVEARYITEHGTTVVDNIGWTDSMAAGKSLAAEYYTRKIFSASDPLRKFTVRLVVKHPDSHASVQEIETRVVLNDVTIMTRSRGTRCYEPVDTTPDGECVLVMRSIAQALGVGEAEHLRLTGEAV